MLVSFIFLSIFAFSNAMSRQLPHKTDDSSNGPIVATTLRHHYNAETDSNFWYGCMVVGGLILLTLCFIGIIICYRKKYCFRERVVTQDTVIEYGQEASERFGQSQRIAALSAPPSWKENRFKSKSEEWIMENAY